MILSRHSFAKAFKKVLFPKGEHYRFGDKNLLFEVGSRPIRRKYIDSGNDIVRNDVLQIEFFEKNFKENDILWDIGSHHGHYSIFAASIVKGSNQVFSFEPDADARSVQKNNIALNALNNKIILSDKAVSNVNGEIMFASQGGNSNSHLVKNVSEGNDDNVVRVQSQTLNNLSDKLPMPTFIKIDTEGAEIDILREAGTLLSDKNIRFICELHPFAWKSMNVTFPDLISVLSKYEREIILLDPQKNLNELPYYGTVVF